MIYNGQPNTDSVDNWLESQKGPSRYDVRLQADPTLIFAAKKYAEKKCDCLSNVKLLKHRDVCYEFCEGDSIIRRVLKKHIKIESNTVNPIQEHSINRLDKLENEMMIGEQKLLSFDGKYGYI